MKKFRILLFALLAIPFFFIGACDHDRGDDDSEVACECSCDHCTDGTCSDCTDCDCDCDCCGDCDGDCSDGTCDGDCCDGDGDCCDGDCCDGDCCDGDCDCGCCDGECGEDCDCDCCDGDCGGGGGECGEDCDCDCCGDCSVGDHKAVAPSASSVTPWSLPNMNDGGTLYKAVDHTNGIFVLENYFLNCPYCSDNAPNVKALHQEFANYSQVQVMDVGVDKYDRQYADWINRHKPSYPVLKDDAKALTSQLGTRGYPSTYIVDCNMNVVYQTSGVWNSRVKAEIRAKIRDLMERPCYLTLPGDK